MKCWTSESILETLDAGVDLGEVERLVDKIGPILAGKFPAVQGYTLAELLALWLLGHDADLREELLKHHIETVRALIEGRQ